MIVTSGAMAVARGQAYDAAGQVLLCTSHGVTLVTVDADGEPVEVPHFCPDCILAMAAALTVSPVFFAFDPQLSEIVPPVLFMPRRNDLVLDAKARAPPS